MTAAPTRFAPVRWLFVLGLLAPMLAGCAARQAPAPAAPAPPPVAVTQPAPPLPPLPPLGGDADFQAFIRDFEPTAIGNGVTAETYNKAVAGIAPVSGIGQIMDSQPEFAKPVWSYLDTAVSARRVRDGQLMLARYAAVLAGIEARSGVPKEILAGIWGMETDFGTSLGSYGLFAALATQASSGARQAYARREFLAALQILQRENYDPAAMPASWAGAFGQTQFMPTTFFKYATDGDGDGKIDLWRSPADALASTATLLRAEGWQTGQAWGYEVRLPEGFAFEDADLDSLKPLSDWAARGLRLAGGAPLPAGEDAASVYLPGGAQGPAFLLFNNFRVIMKYNNAAAYALGVALLGDRMAGGGVLQASWPRAERPLSRAERSRFQNTLKALGYDPGESDGMLGRRTRNALRSYQKAKSLPADGFPTAALLAALEADAKSVPAR